MSAESLEKVGDWFESLVQQQQQQQQPELEVWINDRGMMVFGREDYTWPSCSLKTTDFDELIGDKLSSQEKQFKKKDQHYSQLQGQFDAIFEEYESDEEID